MRLFVDNRRWSIIPFCLLALCTFGQCKTASKKTPTSAKVEKEHVSSNVGAKIPPKAIKIKPFKETSMKKSTYSLWNQDKSMELKIERESKLDGLVYHYIYEVYKKDTKEKIKEGKVTGMALEWNDNTSLKLTPYIGMIEKQGSDDPDDLDTTQTQVTIIKLN